MKFTTYLLFSFLFLLTTPAFADSSAADSSAPESAKPTTNQSEAQKRYNERSLYAMHLNLPPLTTKNEFLDRSWFDPRHGPYGIPLSDREFYQALGDPDLLAQYDANISKKATSNTLIISGSIAGVATLTWAVVWSLAFAPSASPSTESLNENISAGLFAVSIATIIAGLIIAPDNLHPLKADDASQILDEYNNSLKQELGLPQDYSP